MATTATHPSASRVRRALLVGVGVAVAALVAVSAAFAADFLEPGTSPEPSQAGPAGLAVGDVDNDGDADIVASALFSVAASTLLNDGSGNLSEVPIGSNAATIDAGLGNFDADSNLTRPSRRPTSRSRSRTPASIRSMSATTSPTGSS